MVFYFIYIYSLQQFIMEEVNTNKVELVVSIYRAVDKNGVIKLIRTKKKVKLCII